MWLQYIGPHQMAPKATLHARHNLWAEYPLTAKNKCKSFSYVVNHNPGPHPIYIPPAVWTSYILHMHAHESCIYCNWCLTWLR